MEQNITKLATDIYKYLHFTVSMIEYKEYVETCGFVFHMEYKGDELLESCKALFIIFGNYFPQLTIKIKNNKIIVIFRFHTFIDTFENIIQGKALPIPDLKPYPNTIEEEEQYVLVSGSNVDNVYIPKTNKNIYIIIGSVINQMTFNPSFEYTYGKSLITNPILQ